jgi:hypothetical protein
MEFKRIEIKREVASQKRVDSDAEAKYLFELMLKNKMKFAATVGGIGELRDCSVMKVGEDSVQFHAGYPAKLKKTAKFTDIMVVEVECNVDFIADDSDDEGRWARIN